MSHIVVDLEGVKPGEQCPIVFEGTKDQCVDIIDTLPGYLGGRYQIDVKA
jgi:hypothetical protein